MACNGCKMNCIFAARINQDVIGWIEREQKVVVNLQQYAEK